MPRRFVNDVALASCSAEAREEPAIVVGLPEHVVGVRERGVGETEEPRARHRDPCADPELVLPAHFGERFDETRDISRMLDRRDAIRSERAVEEERVPFAKHHIPSDFIEPVTDHRPQMHSVLIARHDPHVVLPTDLLHVVHERYVPGTVARGQMGEVREHHAREALRVPNGPEVCAWSVGAKLLERHGAEPLLRHHGSERRDERFNPFMAAARVPHRTVRSLHAHMHEQILTGVEYHHWPSGDALECGCEQAAAFVEVRVLLRGERRVVVLGVVKNGKNLRSQGVLLSEVPDHEG